MCDLQNKIVGTSPAMVALRAYLSKVAHSMATVLITGATGTGKELVAELLHAMGPRHRQPFVAINCASLPDSLVESELFGHERGAFTGAIGASPGYFARANHGTLLLDEIGEMSLYTQAKLLRVLETHEVMPVGGNRPMLVDVRIIAATNQPLETLIESRQFRMDLFYRLNVAHLSLPPLKERKEDIPLLFNQVIDEYNRQNNLKVGYPDRELLDCLVAHDWPGNIRELRNLVEAIFIDPPRERIGLGDLPPVFRKLFEGYRTCSSSERDQLMEVLEQTQWNKAEAAKKLNWSRMTLYRKLARYHIEHSR